MNATSTNVTVLLNEQKYPQDFHPKVREPFIDGVMFDFLIPMILAF